MFKRKDRKSKSQERDPDDAEKTSSELSRRSPQPKDSMDSMSIDSQASKNSPQPHRQTSKLQKQPPAKLSPKSSYQQQRDGPGQKGNLAEQENGFVNAEPTASRSQVSAYPDLGGTVKPSQSHQQYLQDPQLQSRPQMRDVAPIDSSVSNSLQNRSQEVSPTIRDLANAAATVTTRLEADSRTPMRREGLETSTAKEVYPGPEPNMGRPSQDIPGDGLRKEMTPSQHHMAIAQAAQHENVEIEAAELTKSHSGERLSESPVQVLPPDLRQDLDLSPPQRNTPHRPPPLNTDTSSTEEPSTISPVSPSSSPELVERPSDDTAYGTNNAHLHTTSLPHGSKDVVAQADGISSEDEPAEFGDRDELDPQSAVSSTRSKPPKIETHNLSPSTAIPTEAAYHSQSQPPSHPISSPATTTPSKSSPSSLTTTSAHQTPTSAVPFPTWSESNLRAYLDHDSSTADIRDLLLVVHDKSGVVVPTRGRDHPRVRNLYKAENDKLDKLGTDLDGLLGAYLARKKNGSTTTTNAAGMAGVGNKKIAVR